MDTQDRKTRRTTRTLATGSERLYMGVAGVEAVVIVGLTFGVFGLIEANVSEMTAKVKTVPVYLAVFILAQIFSLLYVFDALRARSIVQLGLHLVFNVCILVYAILQIPQTHDALASEPRRHCGAFARCTGKDSLFELLEKIMIAVPVVLGVCTLAMAVLVRTLYKQFGWAVWHLVNASPSLKRMHRDYQTLISLLKLLLFFAMAFCIALLVLVTTNTAGHRAEFVITIIALPVVILIEMACGWALRKENKPVMAGCLVFMVAGLAYFIYKLASMWLPATAYLYVDTRITLAIFGKLISPSSFSILILIVTFAYGCLCMSNFGQGLLYTHEHPENKTSMWAMPSNIRFQDKAKMDAEQDRPVQPQLIID